MAQEMVSIPKKEYELLKTQANVDLEFIKDLMEGFADIKAGRVTRVR